MDDQAKDNREIMQEVLEYQFQKRFDAAVEGSYWKGQALALRQILQQVQDCRNQFEGPSLDYMQGYRDGQHHLQNMIAELLGEVPGAEDSSDCDPENDRWPEDHATGG